MRGGDVMMEKDRERFEDTVLLPLKMEEWVMSQGRRFLETGKGEEMDPSPGASRRTLSCQYLDLVQQNWRFQTSRTGRE